MSENAPIISIIVPVYNVQDYLNKCLSSIVSQSFKQIEIILVNDGSTDNSGNICDKWAKKDRRIHVLHKENGGVSSARNSGIEKAIGDYLCFVDADDWLPIDSLEYLYNSASSNDADFCFGAASAIGAITTETYGENSGLVLSTNETSKFIEYTDILRSELGPWAKLFKTDIIKKNAIKFDINISYGEDRVFIWNYLKYADNVSATQKIVYFYSQLNPSRACGRYYDNTNLWLYKAVNEYSKIFKDKEIAKEKICSVAIKQMDVCLRHYVVHQKDNPQVLFDKARQTIDLFHDYISLMQVDKSFCEKVFKDLDDRIKTTYSVYIDGMDLDKLIRNLELFEGVHNSHSVLKLVCRNIIARLKRKKIYRVW